MPQIQTILCPIAFTDFSGNTYRYAQSLAGHFKASLFLQHVLYSLPPFDFWYAYPESYEESCRKRRAEAERRLREFVQRHGRQVQPQCFVRDGLIADQILDFADSVSADLIVMGSHGLRGIDRLMLGSMTEGVLRRAKCPVLVARKPTHDGASAAIYEKSVHLKKILVCMDFSGHANRALSIALSIAEAYGADLTLLHVLDNPPRSTDIEAATFEATEKMRQSIPADGCGSCKLKSVVRVGKPHQQIVQFALETRMDLVILGVRGHGSLDSALFGSTAYRVIQLGSCSVLAVHI